MIIFILFILFKQVFTGCLLCARQHSRHWEHITGGETYQLPAL